MGIFRRKASTKKDYSHCYGCGLCTLVCPAWHQSRDVRATPHGHAKAMQVGADIDVTGLFDCILCGACEPVCPANIDIMQMLIDLRRQVVGGASPVSDERPEPALSLDKQEVLLLADEALIGHERLLGQTLTLLNAAGIGRVRRGQDNGSDIVDALQSGFEIATDRVDEFLMTIKYASQVIVSDGLLKTALHRWLPAAEIVSLGYVLSKLPAMQKKLGSKDLYIIESRAYNADFNNMVRHYDQLKRRSGCRFNLDLQRLAMPTGGIGAGYGALASTFEASKQGQWILQGLDIERIIVERVEDGMVMAQLSDKPVIHLAELLADG